MAIISDLRIKRNTGDIYTDMLQVLGSVTEDYLDYTTTD